MIYEAQGLCTAFTGVLVSKSWFGGFGFGVRGSGAASLASFYVSGVAGVSSGPSGWGEAGIQTHYSELAAPAASVR